MSFAPQRKPAAPAPTSKPAAAPAPAPAAATAAPKPLKAVAAGMPVEPADSPLERQADEVARHVVAGGTAPSLPTVRANPTIPGARALMREPGRPAVPPAQGPQDDRRALAPAPASTPASTPTSTPGQPPGPAGEPLPEGLRQTLEQRMGADLSDVRVHQGAEAQAAAQDLGARAFTAGSEIWLGPGESAHDLALMAHEAAHVVQQRQPGVAARLMRATAAEPPVDPTQLPEEDGRYTPGAGARPGLLTFHQVGAPGFKLSGDRGTLWAGRASTPGLKYRKNYQRGNPDQRNRWRQRINKQTILSTLQAKEEAAHKGPYTNATHYFSISLGRQQAYFFGTMDDIAAELTLPSWTHGPSPEYHRYDVDHTVELQVAYWPADDWANDKHNYELLDSEVNQASGRKIKEDIDARLQRFITASRGALGRDVDQLKDRFDLAFRGTTAISGQPQRLGRDLYWTPAEIEAGQQLNKVVAAGPGDFGRAGEARLLGRASGGVSKRFTWSGGPDAEPPRDTEKDWLSPFVIVDKHFNTAAADVGNDDFGTLRVTVPPNDPLWRRIRNPREVGATRITGARYAGTISKAAVRTALTEELKLKGASPIELDSFDLEDGGIMATGRIVSDIPLLRNANIQFSIQNGETQLYKVFSAPEFPLPPPFAIDELSLTLFASTRRGLGARGNVAFSIRGLGQGTVAAETSTDGPMQFGGHFDFDTRWFVPARLSFTYNAETDQWSGEGDIGLKPDTLPGIETATGHVAYDGTRLNGSLTVVPKLRALQQGQLEFSHSEAEGSRFAGTLTLSDAIPNVRGGQLQAVLTQAPGAEGFSFSATGDLESGFAGFSQRLHVEYRDGGFLVEGQGDFRRGMLSGSATIAATNYAVDEAGQRGSEPTEVITAYGGGQVSVTLTPWLVATGRIRLLPNGEIELFGELALPPALPLFDERPYRRRLAELNLDIPIFGVAVAGQRIGIFATVGAGLDLTAGIGPGQLRDTRLDVTYNPAHEDQTTVHGQAAFVVPAHAGLRMFVRGALGAGIPVVSAELGLEAGGEIGLAGEARAEAAVDWSPGRGLVLDAMGSVFVQPRFKFDLTGFAEVTADLLVTEVELYSERWQLASFEVGSSLRFGVEFPLHYEEGQPFDVDWDRVRFITPDVDVGAMMEEVIGRVV